MSQHKFARATVYFTLAIPEELVDLMVAEVNNIDESSFQEATIGTYEKSIVSVETRNSKINWWHEDHWVTSIFSHYFNRANRELWEYDLTYLKGIQITNYEEGDKYNWHADYGTEPDANHTRKLSATLLVSDPESFDGGDLEFIDYHGNFITAPKTKGTLIIFDSRIPHRVTPVTKGKRTSLVAWMLGPKLR